MAWRHDFETNNWEYTENRGEGIRLTRYIGSEQDIRLPAHICGKPVRSLCAGAFPPGLEYRITLPATLTDADAASLNADNIVSVHVSANNPFICADKWGVLYHRLKKQLLRAPRDLGKTYAIGEGTLSVADRAFALCDRLTAVQLPQSIVSLGAEAFYGCAALRIISLPSGLTELGEGAFYGCAALRSVYVPGDVRRLSPEVFAECVSLERLTLGVGIERVCRGALRNCQSLKKLSMPFTLTYAERGAAEGCSESIVDAIQKRTEA